jgi:hypothetical protein
MEAYIIIGVFSAIGFIFTPLIFLIYYKCRKNNAYTSGHLTDDAENGTQAVNDSAVGSQSMDQTEGVSRTPVNAESGFLHFLRSHCCRNTTATQNTAHPETSPPPTSNPNPVFIQDPSMIAGPSTASYFSDNQGKKGKKHRFKSSRRRKKHAVKSSQDITKYSGKSVLSSKLSDSAGGEVPHREVITPHDAVDRQEMATLTYSFDLNPDTATTSHQPSTAVTITGDDDHSPQLLMKDASVALGSNRCSSPVSCYPPASLPLNDMSGIIYDPQTLVKMIETTFDKPDSLPDTEVEFSRMARSRSQSPE